LDQGCSASIKQAQDVILKNYNPNFIWDESPLLKKHGKIGLQHLVGLQKQMNDDTNQGQPAPLQV
jgi:hypothetical protein